MPETQDAKECGDPDSDNTPERNTRVFHLDWADSFVFA
jgi:hypothetical protein